MGGPSRAQTAIPKCLKSASSMIWLLCQMVTSDAIYGGKWQQPAAYIPHYHSFRWMRLHVKSTDGVARTTLTSWKCRVQL